ncbi:SRPBCC family protein [Dongia deserti]|uniref:SRPBCC family protein n=1 Tax=Dongia deserti TaxID=2268030 RepID=UPI000E64EE11|nr:SRPBCC family protein [Dongia deserti]
MTKTLTVTTPSDREIVLSRTFNAPRNLVFDALTKPELVKRWMLGNVGASMPVCEIDLKVGGAYRFVWRSPDGSEFAMNGLYREIVRPERIVNTQRMEAAWLPGELVLTTTLAESGGITTFTSTTLCDSRETRDKLLKGGMESGASASYDRLADVLVELLR